MSGQAIELLLVEDNPVDADLVLHILNKEDLGAAVSVARDGEEALEFLFGGAGKPPAALKLILLDLKLPKVDGLEILRQLRSHPRTRAVPVAIFSSSAVAADVVRSYSLGANSYVVKPVDFRSFSDTVVQLARYWLRLNCPADAELVAPAHRPAAGR